MTAYQTLTYDEENRLVEVQEGGDVVGSYVYDGDGNRVMSTGTVGNTTTTTLYVGAYYEKVNTRVYQNKKKYTDTLGWKKYYYAGSVRLAMREDSDDPLYLISDHLGSTSLVLDTSGQEVAKQSYLPFGEEWGVSATELPTTFTYTGQREAAEIGLMYYVARWYDSYLNHFTQPDTIIADPYNPMAWNRYAYANYNPIKYTDPTGHIAWIAVGAIIGAAISYGIQVYDNYDSGMSGAEAWTDVSVAEIVGGAIIGASVVAVAPVAAAAAGDLLVGVGVTTGSTALIVAGNDAYGLSQTLTNFIYPISYSDYPTLEIDSGSMPNIADNIQNAQNCGASSTLTRTTDVSIINTNRNIATRGFTGMGPGLSADEYPFASTYQGGEGAFVQIVPIKEQWIQGGTLAQFYSKYNILDGDKFNVIIK